VSSRPEQPDVSFTFAPAKVSGCAAEGPLFD
jgi:hypothetical protein